MASVCEGENLEANLKTLSKLERGNMLAKANANGRLVRKTNWLTKASNNAKTHDEELFVDLEVLLKGAEEKISPNPDANQELVNLYVGAIRGLETLLATYRSKGSKETGLIDQLSILLASHAKNIGDMERIAGPKSFSLKELSINAIHYLIDARIRSTNNIHKAGWGNSYFDNKTDKYIFWLIVRSAAAAELGSSGKTAKDFKTLFMDIARRPISRDQKKQLLAEKLSSWFGNDKGIKNLYSIEEEWYQFSDKAYSKCGIVFEEEIAEFKRIQYAKKAIRARFGNCGEKSNIVATHLIESTKGKNSRGGKIGICRVHGTTYDHAWVFLSEDRDRLVNAIRQKSGKSLFPQDTWVVDGWTRDWWKLHAWVNNVPNIRQLGVRLKIRNAIDNGTIVLDESVKWPPHHKLAWFRLRYAHITKLEWDNMIRDPNFKHERFQQAYLALRNFRNQLEGIFQPRTVGNVLSSQDAFLDEVAEITP